MAELTNLTDRLAHLRDRKGHSSSHPNTPSPKPSQNTPAKRARKERRFATDSFMLFAYALLGIALVTQLILIVWLDII